MFSMAAETYAEEGLEVTRLALAESWEAATSRDDRWSEQNPALGQCAVTACVVQDLHGGDVVKRYAYTPDGQRQAHFANVLPNNQAIDMTRQQFPEGTVFGEAQPTPDGFASMRAFMLADYGFSLRYDALRSRVLAELDHPDAPGVMDK